MKFEKVSFARRMGSMLNVDFRRMFKSKLFYILIACALIMPILMTVMMAMMDGSVSVNPQTGEETIMQGPENTWQNIGTLPGEPLGGDEIFMMCNINMMFMATAVFVCLFISDDFRSGYVKNLFTVRAKRGEYVFSKTLAGFVCGALMLIAYLVGSILGGAISGLSFDLHGLNAGNQDVKQFGLEHSAKINLEHTFHTLTKVDFLKFHCFFHSHLPPFIRSM